jgi:enoyl-CoA hydratase
MEFPTTKVLKLVRHDDFTATVLLCDERKGNPMGLDFWNEMLLVFRAIDLDDSIRAVVISTEQANFTYGLDLIGVAPTLIPMTRNGLAGRLGIESTGKVLQAAFNAVAHCRKPVIASISGWCVGAGVELMAACDARVCSADTKFALPEVRMGMVCDVGGIQRLPFIIGEGNTRLIAMTGMDFSAAKALSMGLVSEVLPDAQAALAAARSIASLIAKNPPRVVESLKQVMNSRIDVSVQAGLEQALLRNTSLMQADDFKEAMSAFMEKRKPEFTGK